MAVKVYLTLENLRGSIHANELLPKHEFPNRGLRKNFTIDCEICNECDGRGKVNKYTCPTCLGQGNLSYNNGVPA